jgi:IS5 family transposase
MRRAYTFTEGLFTLKELVDFVHCQPPATKGNKGAEVDGVQILRSGQRRGVTRTMKAMIKRRSAIEPTIGHMKSDGRLDRNPLKGALGDALHAVLCGAGHNIRLLLSLLRLFVAHLMSITLAFLRQAIGHEHRQWT